MSTGDSDFKAKTFKLRQLAEEQIKAADDYFNKMVELEQVLADCRLHMSLAKAQNGFALSQVGFVDNREIEPTCLVEVTSSNDGDKYEMTQVEAEADVQKGVEDDTEDGKPTIRKRGGKKQQTESQDNADSKEDEDNEKEPEQPKKPLKPQFRPFGLLEPRPAKTARAKAKEALERICELASIQSSMFVLGKQIAPLDASIIESLGEDYDSFLKISEDSLDQKAFNETLSSTTWLKVDSE